MIYWLMFLGLLVAACGAYMLWLLTMKAMGKDRTASLFSSVLLTVWIIFALMYADAFNLLTTLGVDRTIDDLIWRFAILATIPVAFVLILHHLRSLKKK